MLPNKSTALSETENKNFQYGFSHTKHQVAKENNKINYISTNKIKHHMHYPQKLTRKHYYWTFGSPQYSIIF